MELVASMQRSALMTLVNVATGGVLEAQFNPGEWDEVLGASYARQTVPGLSHKVKQFTNTEDAVYNLELFYRVTEEGEQGLARILDARGFLTALVHPRRVGVVSGGGAPRALFIWPAFTTIEAVVTSLRFNYTRFNKEGTPVSYTARLTLEQIRDEHVTMEDILGDIE